MSQLILIGRVISKEIGVSTYNSLGPRDKKHNIDHSSKNKWPRSTRLGMNILHYVSYFDVKREYTNTVIFQLRAILQNDITCPLVPQARGTKGHGLGHLGTFDGICLGIQNFIEKK